MYVCWDVHRDTYLDILVGRVIIIKCQDNNLSCCPTTWLYHLFSPPLYLSGFTSGFQVLWLLYYTCSCPAFPFIFYSTSLLLLSPYIIHVPSLISITASLLVPVCWYSQHGFQCMIMIQFYQYTSTYLGPPSGIHITTRRGVLTPLDPHVQVSKLRLKGILLAED